MALNLDGEEPSLFSHNRDFAEGVKERGIRPGQATVVVALDGSGDAESIQEGIDMLPKTGGVIYIKEGIYYQKTPVVFTSGSRSINLIGSGKATILKADAVTWTVDSVAIINGANNPSGTYRDIYMDLTEIEGSYDVGGVSLGANSIISHCWFKKTGTPGGISTNGNNEVMQNKFDGCSIGMQVYGNKNNIIGNIILNKGSIDVYGNYNTISANIVDSSANDNGIYITGDRNVITGNIFTNNLGRGIYIYDAGAANNLIVSNISYNNTAGNLLDNGTNTQPNGAMGTTNLAFDDLNMIT